MRARTLLTRLGTALGVLLTVGAVGLSPAAAIANGVAAETGDFPFAVQLTMTGIQPTGGAAYDSACSAALVSTSWVMTAGHCFHDGNRNRVSGAPRYVVTARLGTATASDPAVTTRTVTWVEQSSKNDIALARLDQPVQGITPLALNTGKPARGGVLTFAGWGATSASGSWSDQLYWGQVKVATIKPSTVMVRGYYPAPDTSACPYDSGAPYFSTGTSPVLVSVESNGPACPHSSQETTARVDVIAAWAQKIMAASAG